MPPLLVPLKLQISIFWAHLSPGEPASFPNVPPSGRQLSKIRSRARYPVTKGKPGGKLPIGKRASRSPCFSFSAAVRKAATNQAYIL